MNLIKNNKIILTLTVAIALLIPSVAFAANTPNLSQVINTGTLATDILDSSRAPVATPSFALGATNFSFSCQTTTGTLGDNNNRVYVMNPDAADNGWTLAMAATSGPTANWSAGTPKYDFNDPTGSGCTDGADADSLGGQLTVNPSVGTLAADCSGCATTNITKGASTAYSEGSADSVTLLNAAASSDDVGRWYLTGVGLSQAVPAEQAVGTYNLGMTITVTAS